MNSKFGGGRLEIVFLKIWRFFNSNTDIVITLISRNMAGCEYFFQNITRWYFLAPKCTVREFFNSINQTVWYFMFQNHVFRNGGKMQNMPFSRSNMIQHVIFLYANSFSIWHILRSSIQNLTRCIYFISNPDTLLKCSFKICCVANFLIQVWHFVYVSIRNLMPLNVFISKSNSLYNKKAKTIHELKIWNQNLTGHNVLYSKLVWNAFFWF